MPDLNAAPVQFGQSTWNPGTALSNKLGGGNKSRSGGGITGQLVQHSLNKDLATHIGSIESNLSAQQSGERMTENAATHRHEIRKTVLEHNNDLAKTAIVHHNSQEAIRTQSGLTIKEGAAAHANAVDLMGRLSKLSEGGTEVGFTHGNVKASFTRKKRAPKAPKMQQPPAQEAPAETPPAPKGAAVGRDPKTGRAISLKKK
jgi:hypothetical protein